jgi:ribosome assembly protein YihI (activator of Der GTPase)
MNLMEIDAFETDEQLQTWIDRIEKGVIPSRSRLTYVEITASRAGLYQWPVRATKPEEAEELDGFDIG